MTMEWRESLQISLFIGERLLREEGLLNEGCLALAGGDVLNRDNNPVYRFCGRNGEGQVGELQRKR